jgi:hypothetical protein
VLIPEMVTALAVVSVLSAAFVTLGVKSNAFGVVSAASVVTDHTLSVEPMETVAVWAVEKEALEVRRTARVWPLVTLPLVPHAPPAIDICGLPWPATLTSPGQPAGIPLMVTAEAVVSVESAAFVALVKVKALDEPLPNVPVTPSSWEPQRRFAAVNCGSFEFRNAASVQSPASSF